MIARHLEQMLKKYATIFPVVSVLGPRQSGKTTLCKFCFPEKKYISLENVDERLYALQDPKGFLARFPKGALIDEAQYAPELFSYIQGIVDEKKQEGMFILTGSQNFLLSKTISQSLAGRTAILTLLPLSNQELFHATIPSESVWERIWKGGYPRIYEKNISPHDWIPFYIQTYLERDVREMVQIENLSLFTRFLQLMAAHTAQELSMLKISNDLGVVHSTIKKWVSILEQSFLITILPPWFSNIKKRIVKTPKFHFLDTGIACSLLKIQSVEQLQNHPLKGALFESWVVSEKIKQKYATNSMNSFFHYRENNGVAFDIIEEVENSIIPYEIKSSETIRKEMFKNFSTMKKRDTHPFQISHGGIIYAGSVEQIKDDGSIWSWKNV